MNAWHGRDRGMIRGMLAVAVENAGGMGPFCRLHGINRQNTENTLNGKLRPYPAILKVLGLRRVVLETYVKQDAHYIAPPGHEEILMQARSGCPRGTKRKKKNKEPETTVDNFPIFG